MGGKLEGCGVAFRLIEAMPVMTDVLSKICSSLPGFPVGSIRRQRPFVNDVDVLVMPRNQDEEDKLAQVLERFGVSGWKKCSWTEYGVPGDDGRMMASFARPIGSIGMMVQVDVFVIRDKNALGAATQCWTGPARHNVALRQWGLSNGLKVSQNGISRVATEKKIETRSEAEFYRALGLPLIPVNKRDNFLTVQGLVELRTQVSKGDFEV